MKNLLGLVAAVSCCAALVFADTKPAAADSTLTTLYTFTGGTDGAGPSGRLLLGADGSLYGTTGSGGISGCTQALGCGTVFKLTPPAQGQNALAWTETVLYRFKGGSDAFNPSGPLVSDTAGALYGTTVWGGANGWGTVFKLGPPVMPDGTWTETVLHSFQPPPSSDGADPAAGVVLDASGALYGTTPQGGANNAGLVFKLGPPVLADGTWTETVLHSFVGGNDGQGPNGGLVFDASGALYGTTSLGGTHNAGTVFKLGPPVMADGTWTKTVLYSFEDGSDGQAALSGLIFDASGALYGTTIYGGGNGCIGGGCGTVFKLGPPVTTDDSWTETVLYRFVGGTDGGAPVDTLVFDGAGSLYGTTIWGGIAPCGLNGNLGCGTVFKLGPPVMADGTWTEAVLYRFTGGSDGFSAGGGLISDASGVLYGTSGGTGVPNFGTVFTLTPPFLSFPLQCGAPIDSQGNCSVPYGQGAYTLTRINTVLDHHMIPYPSNPTFWQYGTIKKGGGDAIITAYDGETVGNGMGYNLKYPECILGEISLGGLVKLSVCGSGYTSYDEHPGYDYVAQSGSSVMAVADGTVVDNNGQYCYTTFSTNANALCTKFGYVGIDHGNSYISQYGHLQVSTISVTPGQQIKRGDLIGLSGHTGLPCGPNGCPNHLHFEVLKSVNGARYFVDPYGWSGNYADPLYCPSPSNCDPSRPASVPLWQ